jgi:hypothetical protein
MGDLSFEADARINSKEKTTRECDSCLMRVCKCGEASVQPGRRKGESREDAQ